MLAVGVSGGAAYPSMQAAVGDKHGTQISYMIPFTGFVVLTACASFPLLSSTLAPS